MENLITELKKEHEILLNLLERLKTTKIGSGEWNDEIKSVENTFLFHLKHEDKNLYLVLSEASFNNSQLKTTLNIFAKDMDDISKEAVEFFKETALNKEGKDLIKSFAHFYTRIKLKIRREENILYPEFEKCKAKNT